MNITTFVIGKDVYVNCEAIKGYTFKNTLLWVKSALLATISPVLMATLVLTRDNFALLLGTIIDYFECLLPDKVVV
jgi:hypothetical protein